MKKALAKIQKTEINTYIDEFVKARQKYFTDGQEWLEAKVTDEKIYVQIDRKQLEEELDDMIKISLQFGKVLPLEMKIQVRKVVEAEQKSATWTMVPEVGDAAGSMHRRKPEEPLPRKKDGAYRLHNVIDLK